MIYDSLSLVRRRLPACLSNRLMRGREVREAGRWEKCACAYVLCGMAMRVQGRRKRILGVWCLGERVVGAGKGYMGRRVSVRTAAFRENKSKSVVRAVCEWWHDRFVKDTSSAAQRGDRCCAPARAGARGVDRPIAAWRPHAATPRPHGAGARDTSSQWW